MVSWAHEQREYQKKHHTPSEDDRSDDLIGDPLLIIEWNDQGLQHRLGVNGAH
jgi:hypothetical protein